MKVQSFLPYLVIIFTTVSCGTPNKSGNTVEDAETAVAVLDTDGDGYPDMVDAFLSQDFGELFSLALVA
jgi:hypothetical protein